MAVKEEIQEIPGHELEHMGKGEVPTDEELEAALAEEEA